MWKNAFCKGKLRKEGKERKAGKEGIANIQIRCTFVHMSHQKFQNGFRKLIAWKEAHIFTLAIYKVTATFPRQECYGITSQLRRASSSIGAQIAEGSRMPTMQHRKLYYDRAYASAAEVDSFLDLAHDLNYMNDEIYENLVGHINRVSYLVHSLSAASTKQ